MLAAQLGEARPKGRPLPLPAPHADVDVVALREDPAIAAGNDAELELRDTLVAIADDLVRHVALQRDAEDIVAAELEGLADRAVDAISPHEHGAGHKLAVDAYEDSRVIGIDVRHLGSLADVDT